MPKITTVSYSKLYPLAVFSNERIGVEMSLEEGEDAKSALETCKALVHEFHFEANKELYAMLGTKVVSVGDEGLPVQQKQEDHQIDDISLEWATVQGTLEAIEYKEDAIEFLETTSFKHFIPAKNIINSKQSKK